MYTDICEGKIYINNKEAWWLSGKAVVSYSGGPQLKTKLMLVPFGKALILITRSLRRGFKAVGPLVTYLPAHTCLFSSQVIQTNHPINQS